MPHITVQYTANLEAEADMSALCSGLAAATVAQKDEKGGALFPLGGTRVLAYPAKHFAVADNKGDYAFCYIHMRIAGGRSDPMKKQAGDALLAVAQAFFAAAFAKRAIGVTVQVDEAPGQVYDAKHSNLHARFAK